MRRSLRRLVANIPVLIQLVEKSLVRAIHLRLKIEGASRLGIVCTEILIELLCFNTQKNDAFILRICNDSGIEMPFLREKSWTGCAGAPACSESA